MKLLASKLDSLPQWAKWILIGGGLILCVWLILSAYKSKIIGVGVDFDWILYPAARGVWTGGTPYENYHFVHVPWAVVPILPYALFPKELGAALYLITSIGLYVVVAHKLGADPKGTFIFLVSPPVLLDIYFGNLNGFALLGLILPPWIGIIFLTIKPQLGIAVGLYWLVEAWRKGGFWQVIRTFAPLGILVSLALIRFGFWPARQYVPTDHSVNLSFWPWMIPLGFWILLQAFRNQSKVISMGASPFIFPYTTYTGYVTVLMPFLTKNLDLLMIVVGMYVTAIVRFIVGF